MFLALEIGGSTIRVAFSQTLSNVKIEHLVTFTNDHNFKQYIQKVIELAKQHVPIEGVGISVTGSLNVEKTMVVDESLSAVELKDQPLIDIFSKEFNCPVRMDNDAIVSALGEMRYGHNELNEFVYLIWGTGIGGAKVSKDKDGITVEMLEWEYFEQWEDDCGGGALRKRYGIEAKDISSDEWKKILDKSTEHLLTFFQKTQAHTIVLHGSIAEAKFEEINKRLVNRKNMPRLLLSKLGLKTGIFGAFVLLEQDPLTALSSS